MYKNTVCSVQLAFSKACVITINTLFVRGLSGLLKVGGASSNMAATAGGAPPQPAAPFILPKVEGNCPPYSHLFNKHGGWNKRGGGAKNAKSLNVEVGINVEGGKI